MKQKEGLFVYLEPGNSPVNVKTNQLTYWGMQLEQLNIRSL